MPSPLGRLQIEELARIQERLRALFERALLPAELPRGEGVPGTWRPAADLVDTGSAYRLQVEVPGASRDDLDVTFQDHTLTVSGRLSPPVDEPAFVRMERQYGAFRRSFRLDEPVDPDGIEARLENGLLTVLVPKNEVSENREGGGEP